MIRWTVRINGVGLGWGPQEKYGEKRYEGELIPVWGWGLGEGVQFNVPLRQRCSCIVVSLKWEKRWKKRFYFKRLVFFFSFSKFSCMSGVRYLSWRQPTWKCEFCSCGSAGQSLIYSFVFGMDFGGVVTSLGVFSCGGKDYERECKFHISWKNKCVP